MRCLVCRQEFEGYACPRCGFPVVESPDADTLLENIGEQVEAYREEFLRQTRVDLLLYRWQQEDDRIQPGPREQLTFGTCAELRGRTVYLSQRFSRIPEAGSVQLELQVVTPHQTRQDRRSLPNITQPGLQEIGLRVDEALNYQLLLRSGETETASEPAALLPW